MWYSQLAEMVSHEPTAFFFFPVKCRWDFTAWTRATRGSSFQKSFYCERRRDVSHRDPVASTLRRPKGLKHPSLQSGPILAWRRCSLHCIGRVGGWEGHPGGSPRFLGTAAVGGKNAPSFNIQAHPPPTRRHSPLCLSAPEPPPSTSLAHSQPKNRD